MKMWLLLMSVMTYLGGCQSVRDVSNDAKLSGGYITEADYRLSSDATLWQVRGDISPPELRYYVDTSPGRTPTRYAVPLGAVARGTRMRLLKTILVTGPWIAPFSTFGRVYPIARIESGPFAGYRVQLAEISGFGSDESNTRHPVAYAKVPGLLERVGFPASRPSP